MIALRLHPEGVVLPIRAQPGARKAGLLGEYNGALKVAVTAPPEDGKANDAIVELLRRTFKLKRSQVELIAGAKSREKKVLLKGLSLEDTRAAITACKT
jgi:uncharacterized protein (TIGR00251 family)